MNRFTICSGRDMGWIFTVDDVLCGHGVIVNEGTNKNPIVNYRKLIDTLEMLEIDLIIHEDDYQPLNDILNVWSYMRNVDCYKFDPDTYINYSGIKYNEMTTPELATCCALLFPNINRVFKDQASFCVKPLIMESCYKKYE